MVELLFWFGVLSDWNSYSAYYPILAALFKLPRPVVWVKSWHFECRLIWRDFTVKRLRIFTNHPHQKGHRE